MTDYNSRIPPSTSYTSRSSVTTEYQARVGVVIDLGHLLNENRHFGPPTDPKLKKINQKYHYFL